MYICFKGMKRRAAIEEPDDWPSLTLTPRAGLVEGTIVIIDLDRFGEFVRERGLSEYSPNDVTGLLSRLVEDLARRWGGVILYGLDWERGTEEAVVEIPGVEASELAGDLLRIAREVCEEGASVTIVAVTGLVGAGRPVGRREAYRGSPDRVRALRLLRRLKRRGGGVVYVDGSEFKACSSGARL